MKKKTTVEQYLEEEPKFRDRVNKDRGIVNLLIKKYPVLVDISKEVLIAAVQDYTTMDRYWRQTLLRREDLRGEDYNDKGELEKEAQLVLGYNIK